MYISSVLLLLNEGCLIDMFLDCFVLLSTRKEVNVCTDAVCQKPCILRLNKLFYQKNVKSDNIYSTLLLFQPFLRTQGDVLVTVFHVITINWHRTCQVLKKMTQNNIKVCKCPSLLKQSLVEKQLIEGKISE